MKTIITTEPAGTVFVNQINDNQTVVAFNKNGDIEGYVSTRNGGSHYVLTVGVVAKIHHESGHYDSLEELIDNFSDYTFKV